MSLLDTISAGFGSLLQLGEFMTKRDAPPMGWSNSWSYGKSGMPAPAKSAEGLLQYQQNPWAYTGTNALIDDFATVELFIRKKIVNADGSVEYEVRREHQALQLLENHLPNTPSFKGRKYLTKTTLKQLVGLHLIGAGEAFWAIGGRVGGFAGFDGVPTELHPLVPSLVSVHFDENTNLIESYGYTVGGKKYMLSPESVVHFKRIDPRNPHRGQSAYLSSGYNLDTDLESDIWLDSWFKNNATPASVVFSEKVPGKEEMKRIREAWESTFGGSRNAGKVSFLWGSKDIKDISRSQRDMQFKELKEFNRDVILANLRVGKGLIGMVDDQNRANAETQEYTFGKHVLKPFLITFCEQLTQDYLPLFGFEEGEEFWFDEDSVVPDDKMTEAQVYEKLWNIGAVSANEVRRKFNLDPRDEPEADMLYTPIGRRGSGEEDVSGLFGNETDEKPEEVEDENDDENENRDDDFFRDIGAPQVLRDSDPIRFTNADELFDDQKEIAAFKQNAEGHVEMGMKAGIDLGKEQIAGGDFTADQLLDLPEARQALETISLEHAVNTLGGTKSILQKVLDQALKEGRSNQELAAAITRLYGKQFKGYRSRRIARTETTGAVNAGTQVVYNREGIERKVWVSTVDGRTRETHVEADQASHRAPVKVQDQFDVGGFKADYPGDPSLPPGERVNCRCTTVSADFLQVMQDKKYAKIFLRQHGSIEQAFVRSLAREFEAQKKRVLQRIS